MLQKNLFSMFKKVATEIAREAAKAKARREASQKKAPPAAPKRVTKASTVPTSAVSRQQVAMGKRGPKIVVPATTEQKRRVQRFEKSVTNVQQRREKFDGYMHRIGDKRPDIDIDRYNRETIEDFIEGYEKQRDGIEEELERRKLELEVRYNERIERLAARHHDRLQRMIDQANKGRRVK